MQRRMLRWSAGCEKTADHRGMNGSLTLGGVDLAFSVAPVFPARQVARLRGSLIAE